ncbi:DUF2382 domain-containing protein [Nibribacter ruber]|uniref:DUF2382 domain-containing protein n=1 Tax=Nibribacter ruber TaxID=2698458 RepID=A0A6P1NYR1_9BACT|nr:PRC-barrel domain-containing protein [Nibribacter ruber]QHL86013.1 DUF2382 domain-containing protein [Nibribacter ruber]
MENSGYSNSKYHLQELGESNYEVAKGTPDIRGWEVIDLQNQFMGRVKELLYDASAGKVRYAVLDLQDNQSHLEPRQVLVPVGMTEVQENAKVVVLSKVSTSQLMALPSYQKGRLNQELETKVLRVFAGEPSIQIEQEQNLQASTASFNQENSQTKTGQAYPKQIAFDTTFSEKDLASFQEGTIELKERIEVPTLHKTPFVVEEIVIGKEVELHEETIYETVKKTEVHLSDVSIPPQHLDQDSDRSS